MKITRWISYLLLFSCVVIVTPRTLWHSCSHTHFLEKKKSLSKKIDSFSSNENSCSFCDFEFSLTEEPFSFNYSFQRSNFKSFVSFTSDLPHQQSHFQKLRRGPPKIGSIRV